jgi:YHS domain-containing protein
MNDLSHLDQQLREKMASAQERRRLHQRHVAQRVEEINQRYQNFAGVADHVTQHLIQPRIELLASYFDNAEPRSEGDPAHRHHCRYEFRHTERFPATATLDLGVCPDADMENIQVVYNLEILPIFFRFAGRDQIAFPVHGVDEPRLVAWIEKKIHDFFDTYLRLEESDHYQRENTVTDPVCGMQINKALAAARLEYQGETYFFCIDECRAKFAEDPQLYVKAVSPRPG